VSRALAERRPPSSFTLVLLAGALSCAGPIVESQWIDVEQEALARIAVAPFVPADGFRASRPPGVASAAEGAGGSEAAALTTRHVTEALAAQGFDVVAASDLELAFESQGKPVPHGDIQALAGVAARGFGATSLLVGTVYRYRERQGGEYGTTRPASVGFEVALHAAPSGALLWKGRFDHTQKAFSEDVFTAIDYPGGGMRWLSAGELTRWGAEAMAEDLRELR